MAREQAKVVATIEKEENAFAEMLQSGLKLLEKELPNVSGKTLAGDTAFKLYDTYGFPLDLTQNILKRGWMTFRF